MKIDQGSACLSAALLGMAGLTYAILREQRVSKERRELKGKVVLVTGGSRGLGYAVARELALSGARLALTSRHADELERARARVLASGCAAPADVWVYPCDVSVEPTVREMVAAATAHFGRIDVLINDAGIIMVGPLQSQTVDSFHQAMNVNFFGALHVTLAVLPQMLERGEGAIVNISSIGGKVAFPHLLPYVASKFAITGWSQGLRAELAGKGIQVTTVCPGIMRTGSHIQALFAGDREGISLVCGRRQPTRNRHQRHQGREKNRARFGRRVGRDLDWPAGDCRRAPFQCRSRADSELAFARECLVAQPTKRRRS